jgi:hypothetical protein
VFPDDTQEAWMIELGLCEPKRPGIDSRQPADPTSPSS